MNPRMVPVRLSAGMTILVVLVAGPATADPPRTLQDLYVRVAPVHAVPTFVISRDPARGFQPFFRPCFETYAPRPRFFEQFAAAGTQLYSFNANAASCDYGHSSPVWLDASTWDYAGLDERVQHVLAANPEAMIMPRVNLGTPRWWLEQHPQECEVLDDGTTRYRTPNRNPTLPPDRPFPSCVSARWRQDLGEALRRLIDHIQASDYAHHIFGYILTGLDTEEWYHWSSGSDQLAGYSPHMRTAFQDWLRHKYGHPANLQKAWRRDDISFEEVTVPSRQERFDLGQGTFRDPVSKMNVIDFYLFYNEIVPDTINHFARIVRERTAGRKVIGAFYGFMYEFRGDPEYGHNALARFNDSPFLDFVYVTASYGNRHFARGGDYSRSPAYSVRLHDKLWYHDNDVVSFMADTMWAGQAEQKGNLNDVETWRNSLGYTRTAQHSIWMYRRSFGFALCHGAYESFFDLHGGYYDHPQLMAEVGQLNRVADQVKRYDRSSNSEILVVADETSCAYATFRSDLLEESLLKTQWQLIKIGAPADHVLLSDLDRLDTERYKLIVFLNCYHVNQAAREVIARKLKTGGKHLWWCYAPGYFNESGGSPEQMQSLAEMCIVPAETDTWIAPQVDFRNSAAPLAEELRAAGFSVVGPDRECCQGFLVKDPQATPLGTMPGGPEVTMAVKPMPDWTSGYCVTPHLPAGVYRQLARQAGVHIYNDRDDTFYANTTFVSLHANGAGPRTIHFPWACNIENVMTGELVGANQDRYSYEFQDGETLILKWRPR